jgi:basic membrane protein A
MSKKLYSLLALLIAAAFVLAACGPAPTPTAAPEEPTAEMEEPTAEPTAEPVAFKACQVTDVGGIDDKSFNATAWKGIEDAIAQLGIEGQYLESQEQADYETNINAFLEQGCDLIITVGFLLGDATAAAANASPDQQFGIIDFAYDPAIPNVTGHVFATDQAAFLAGYVAAANTQTGVVGTFGGLQIPPVTVFMDGFWYGVQYYNDQNGTAVEVKGWDPATQTGLFTGNFESTDDGATFGNNLMDEGADIIMPVAGPVGLGTAAAAQERGGVWIIGVDSDWTQTAPDYAAIVLTSVLKKMDATVLQQITSMINGEEQGSLIVGTLESGGVGLAAVNASATQVDLTDVTAGIIAGEIQTAP